MQTYIVVIVSFVILCAAWGLFQLWMGRQADGTDLDGERNCDSCGAGQEKPP